MERCFSHFSLRPFCEAITYLQIRTGVQTIRNPNTYNVNTQDVMNREKSTNPDTFPLV